MPTVELSHVFKSFGATQAVDDLSFQVQPGEIFGLLGPNGAGKTTTLRLILDIFKPDRGQVTVFNGPLTEAAKNRIGYLPEERGLYQDLPLERVLLYLAALKGMRKGEARRRLDVYLETFELGSYRRRPVKELSKGLQQKAQIIATLLHQPELVLIDEPFSGLDPVNTQRVKQIFVDLHTQGVSIIMSTHQMHQVEELCQRILLVNRGQAVLYGDLASIRRQFSGRAILVHPALELPDPAPLAGLPGVESAVRCNSGWKLELEADCTPQQLLASLVGQGIALDKFEIASPNLEEIFVRVVGESRGV